MQEKQEVSNIIFTCSKCEGELKMTDGGFKYYEELNPIAFGVIRKKRKVVNAECKKCGKITKDYFNQYNPVIH